MANLAGKQDITLDVMGGLIAMSRPDQVPKGGSPRTHDTDFQVGSVATRPGKQSLFSFAGAVAERSPGASTGWVDAANLLTTGLYATTAVPSENLDLTSFAFSVPDGNGITGVAVGFAAGCTAPATLTATLILNGKPIGTPQSFVLGEEAPYHPAFDASITNAMANNTTFGVRFTADSDFALADVFVRNIAIFVSQTASLANFTYLKTFETRSGVVKTLALDAEGNWWIEDTLNTPGELTLLLEGIAPGSYGQSLTLDDREYVCFSNLRSGADVPRQYTLDWIDKITQSGPGAPPTVTVRAVASDAYPIISITQPARQSRGFSYFLQSTGPGSKSPGNIVTIYYSDSTGATADADLVNAFNSGFPVYLWASFTGGPAAQGPYVVQVTSVGEGQPPDQPRQFFYFTYTVPTSAYTLYAGSGHGGYTANYQRTLATLTTSVPVPNLVVNSKMNITGTSVSAYNATFPVSENVDSGNMTISQTTLAAGTATYSYSMVTGVAPAAGQLITITNTLNANGKLNGVDLAIASSTGGSSGSFTISGFNAGTDYAAESEQGLGTTAGTVFDFDPGASLVGTGTNPIYGTSSGGNLVFQGSGQVIGEGIRQLVEFYITRNGAFTFASPPVTFTTPANTSDVVISGASIGPPYVRARGYAITEPGQNGTPGANFFHIAQDIRYSVQGVEYTTKAFIIPDNVTTTATFNFLDAQLIKDQAIDIQGNNLFNQIELGDPGWVVSYKSRLAFGLCKNQIANLLNLSFDGGQRANVPLPLGWLTTDNYGSLIPSPISGNAYYIHNPTGSVLPSAGLLGQFAYQDAYQQAIIRANTLYSVEVTASCPSGSATGGNLVVDLFSLDTGTFYGRALFPISSMGTTMTTQSAPLLTTGFPTVPTGLQFRVYADSLGPGSDVLIDRIRPYPTIQPVDTTSLYVSYINRFEQIDQDTGRIDTAAENQQPCYGGVVMNDILYLLKESSMGYTQDSPGEEPDQWGYNQVSNRAGAGGPLAYDSGEQFITMACRNGLYLFTGGEPGRIMLEIADVWNALNWGAGRAIWVKHDIARQRIYVGVPLPTPNFWLPDAPPNAARTPNVILMCNYEGVESGNELRSASSVRLSGFAGNLEVPDMRRKWSIWQIPALNAAMLKRADSLDMMFALCNGSNSGKIYTLKDGASDDGAAIGSLYTTYAFSDTDKGSMGAHRKSYTYLTANCDVRGKMQVKLYPNALADYSEIRVFPTSTTSDDLETDINTAGSRTFLEFSTNDLGASFDLSTVTLSGSRHPWTPVRGV